MIIRSSTEKMVSEKLAHGALKPVKIAFRKEKINSMLLRRARSYLAASSEKKAIELSVFDLASSLIVRNLDLMGHVVFDRTRVMEDWKKNSSSEKYKADDFYTISIPSWQLLIILSKSVIELNTEVQLANHVLQWECKRFDSLFYGRTPESDSGNN